MKESIAIIGTGIAGMGCGYFLNEKYNVMLFEQNNYAGGHTNTVLVNEEGSSVPIDTGFMVYNEITYPNLTKLFRVLGVPVMDTAMSFSVQHRPTGLEYSGSGLKGLFGQRKNLISPRFYILLRNINRFNNEAREILDNQYYQNYTLGQYVAEKRYSDDFLDKYLIPMSSAVWSTPPDKMLQFPALTLVRFFDNHGFLGMNTQHQWKTVKGGSKVYRDLLIDRFKENIHLNNPVRRVIRKESGGSVETMDGTRQHFDKIIFASHADQALAMLDAPEKQETRLLQEFKYQTNIATLHTDATLMPRTKRIWSSWNYRIALDSAGSVRTSTIYYMNSLQKVSQRENYFVSINDPEAVNPEKILRTITYEHPVYSPGAIRAQQDLHTLNNNGTVYFCGSYFRYGFHEDAFTSAIQVCEKILGEKIW